MTPQERFDELVSGYLDQSADPEGVEELNVLLSTRPDYAARFTAIARLHGALYELEGHPRPPIREPLEKRAMVVALSLLAIGILSGLLAKTGWYRGELLVRELLGLLWFSVGAASGTGAGIILRMDRVWAGRSFIVHRRERPMAYWSFVVALVVCGAAGVSCGLGLWFGRI